MIRGLLAHLNSNLTPQERAEIAEARVRREMQERSGYVAPDAETIVPVAEYRDLIETANTVADAAAALDHAHELESAIEFELVEIVGAELQAELDRRPASNAATLQGYRQRFRQFEQWAAAQGFNAMPYPPPLIAKFYLAERARGISSSTLRRSTAAIKHMHLNARYKDPTDDALPRAVLAYLRKAVKSPASVPPEQPEQKD